MIKIVKIKELKQNQAVIEVEKDGVLIPHISTIHQVYKYRFEEDQVLTVEQYNTFIKDNEFEQLYNRALLYISYQMRTISEVKKHLQAKTKDHLVIQKIITELKKHNYLNDLDYVKEYVTQRILYDTVGPLYIREKLIQKGIHFDLIDEELHRFTEELEYDKIDEIIRQQIKYPLKKTYPKVVESLKRKCVQKGFHLSIIDSVLQSSKQDILSMIDEDALIQKELRSLPKGYKKGTYEETQKLIQKLRSKGFSYEVIKSHIQ